MSQIGFTKTPKLEASVHNYLIEVWGIDGDMILFVSPKTVIYFFIKYEF